MSEENSEIINQLRSIKRWVAVGAVGFLLIGLGIVIFSASMVKMVSGFESEYSEEEATNDSSKSLWDEGSELFEQGKVDELLRRVDERLNTHPNDATAYWFKAKAYYLKREWALALENIEKTELYAPNWKEEYTGPMRDKIKELKQ